MPIDANLKSVPSRESSADSPNRNNKPNGHFLQATKQHVNNATSTELQRNEAAARVRPTIQRVSEQNNGDKESSQESQVNEDEDDPCLNRKKKDTEVDEKPEIVQEFRATPGIDPRFQQQNQTMRCFVMYTDFYRCEKILGDGNQACTWFKDVFTSICPNDWIRRWDELRQDGRLPWSKGRTQGEFPGDRYGV